MKGVELGLEGCGWRGVIWRCYWGNELCFGVEWEREIRGENELVMGVGLSGWKWGLRDVLRRMKEIILYYCRVLNNLP